MRDRCIRYTPFDLDVVTLNPDEAFAFTQQSANDSFGVFYIYGSSIMTQGPSVGRVYDLVNGWLPASDGGWSSEDMSGTVEITGSSAFGCEWICISRNGTGEREIQHLPVDGSATIPAGWGFVVAAGSVDFETKTATQFKYAAPRAADFTVTGTADLLLVR